MERRRCHPTSFDQAQRLRCQVSTSGIQEGVTSGRRDDIRHAIYRRSRRRSSDMNFPRDSVACLPSTDSLRPRFPSPSATRYAVLTKDGNAPGLVAPRPAQPPDPSTHLFQPMPPQTSHLPLRLLPPMSSPLTRFLPLPTLRLRLRPPPLSLPCSILRFLHRLTLFPLTQHLHQLLMFRPYRLPPPPPRHSTSAPSSPVPQPNPITHHLHPPCLRYLHPRDTPFQRMLLRRCW